MIRRRLVLLGGCCMLCACAAGPAYRAPAPDLPAAYASAQAGAAGGAAAVPADMARWWHALGDATLDSLVERAVQSNPDIGVALARLQEARTFEALVIGSALPEVDAAAGAGRGTGSDLTRGRAPTALVGADNGAGLSRLNTIAGFESSWEIDVFGKYRREYQLARAEAEAAAAARDAVLTTVIADVARAYLDLRGAQVQAGILRQAIDALRESQRIVGERYERGITNELDVTLARRELAGLQARLQPLQAQANAAVDALAVLVGAYPEALRGELSRPGLIPTLPGPAAAGTPLELLRRRPDVRQAERELAAATARTGIATANLFPQVGLVASIGAAGQGFGLGPDHTRHIWSFGPAALWPVLDFGTLDAEVDIAGYEAQASLLNYRRTLLQAVAEVDGALDAYSAQQDRVVNLGDALLAGQRAVELATERYERGLSDYLNVIDAQRQLYDVQAQYVDAQVAAIDGFVQLYKSLGGGWQDYQQVPAVRRPQPAIVAMFRRLWPEQSP